MPLVSRIPKRFKKSPVPQSKMVDVSRETAPQPSSTSSSSTTTEPSLTTVPKRNSNRKRQLTETVVNPLKKDAVHLYTEGKQNAKKLKLMDELLQELSPEEFAYLQRIQGGSGNEVDETAEGQDIDSLSLLASHIEAQTQFLQELNETQKRNTEYMDVLSTLFVEPPNPERFKDKTFAEARMNGQNRRQTTAMNAIKRVRAQMQKESQLQDIASLVQRLQENPYIASYLSSSSQPEVYDEEANSTSSVSKPPNKQKAKSKSSTKTSKQALEEEADDTGEASDEDIDPIIDSLLSKLTRSEKRKYIFLIF